MLFAFEKVSHILYYRIESRFKVKHEALFSSSSHSTVLISTTSSSLFVFLFSEEINSFFSPFDEMEEFLCGLCEDKDAF